MTSIKVLGVSARCMELSYLGARGSERSQVQWSTDSGIGLPDVKSPSKQYDLGKVTSLCASVTYKRALIIAILLLIVVWIKY